MMTKSEGLKCVYEMYSHDANKSLRTIITHTPKIKSLV